MKPTKLYYTKHSSTKNNNKVYLCRILSTLTSTSSDNCTQLMIMRKKKALARLSSVQGIIVCSTSVHASGTYTANLRGKRIRPHKTSEGDAEKGWYRIRQNIRGGKLSRFSRILAKRESFTIESFPSSQLENFIIIP